MEETTHLFSKKELWKLLVPLMVEQLLTSLMGTADTIMVSNVGSEAISAVSLVDSINVLVIQAFAALAAGGAILCAHYIGSANRGKANEAARQVLFIITVISLGVMAFCLALRRPLLTLIFGEVDAGVMEAAEIYFLYTACSFPFIAIYDACASIFRSIENSRLPMVISMISNAMNICGNAILIFGFHMGVAGAAISTLISRIFCAIVILCYLRKPKQEIVVKSYHTIRPNGKMIHRILAIGIPSGIENSMFQFGKLVIQSTVSTLGTVAIAAQAMTNVLEVLNGLAAMGIGIGLMTILGQCIGAGREDEAVYYIKRLSILSEFVVIISCAIVLAITVPVTTIGGMEPESAKLCLQMMIAISIVKPLVWNWAFIPAYGLRAAGDVRYSMLVSVLSMWTFRVTLCIYLCRYVGIGPMGVWIGMFTDWTVRGIAFGIRFRSRKFLKHKVI